MGGLENTRTGGVILAAGMRTAGEVAFPLIKMGAITVIRRMVLTYQQAGISPIVVVTGFQSAEIEHELADYGVIFLHNAYYEQVERLNSAKVGLTYLQDKCERVVLSPVNFPFYLPATLCAMLACPGEVVIPVCQGEEGHPILFSVSLIPDILQTEVGSGMKEMLHALGAQVELLPVEDKGVVQELSNDERLSELLRQHNRYILHPFLRISIESEVAFFNARTKMLLQLIGDTQSVRQACKRMALSYGKAWNMLNQLEKELGYAVVSRRHGGAKGGKTFLTAEGEEFLRRYQVFEARVRQYARDEFERIFRQPENETGGGGL